MIDNVKYVELDGKTYLMPSHLQVEVVGGKGMCNASCAMCAKEKWLRPPLVMTDEIFQTIIDQLEPFKKHIEYITLHGNGEPLLDKGLANKVRYAKQKGMNGVGFASNCSFLTKERSVELIEAGLNTIICSVDGLTKKTHEAIRAGTHFESVVENVQRFIEIRNRIGQTKVLVRFIRQELNKQEFPEYQAYWKSFLNPKFGDDVLVFNIHNWGSQIDVDNKINEEFGGQSAPTICADIYHRLLVFPNGDLAFCDADFNGFYDVGNIMKGHFLKLYNGEKMNFYRKSMEEGKIRDLPFCKECSIPLSRANKPKS